MQPHRHAAQRQPLQKSGATNNGNFNCTALTVGSNAGKNLSSSRSNGLPGMGKPMDSRMLSWAQASFQVHACHHKEGAPRPAHLVTRVIIPNQNVCLTPGSNRRPFACEANVITNYTSETELLAHLAFLAVYVEAPEIPLRYCVGPM